MAMFWSRKISDSVIFFCMFGEKKLNQEVNSPPFSEPPFVLSFIA